MKRRSGFTLIELMVAMALIVFIMTILSQSFVTGLETFRQLKGIGDMQEGLRSAATRIKADLQAEHFEGKRRLSDPAFWSEGAPSTGFFAIPGYASVSEGLDLDGILSSQATNHYLHFTVRERGNRPEAFFQVPVPAGSPLLTTTSTQVPNAGADARYQTLPNAYSSQWAEVGYYLIKHGTTDDPENPASAVGTPLFSLYRAQRVLVPNNSAFIPPAATYVPSGLSASYINVSHRILTASGTPYLHFLTPREVAQATPNRSLTLPTATVLGSSALVLSNVVSFQVRAMTTPGGDFADLPGALDTATGAGFNIYALQIIIRVWDPATTQARQLTLIQDM